VTLALVRPSVPDLGEYSLGNRDLLLKRGFERTGLSQEGWDRLNALLLRDLEFQQVFGGYSAEVQQRWCEVLNDQMLGFLLLCGLHGGYSPSLLVDIPWHAYMLDSRPYMHFCEVNFGKYVHHRPCLGSTTQERKRAGLERTVRAMLDNGISVIHEAWTLAKLNMQCDDDTCEGDTKVAG
jgi:hypothetical protein